MVFPTITRTTFDLVKIGAKIYCPPKKPGMGLTGYEITDLIHPDDGKTDGQSVIFKARGIGNSGLFAIKFPLVSTEERNRELMPHFLRERLATHAVRPYPSYFVGSVDEGTYAQLPYFVMNYLEGWKTLNELIGDKEVNWAVAKRIIENICEALFILHRAKAVHRDVKIENVFARLNAQERPEVRISDFGIIAFKDLDALKRFAKDPTLFAAGAAVAATDMHVALGTSRITPDELFLQNRYDARLDIRALGILIREFLSADMGADFPANVQLTDIQPFTKSALVPNVPAIMDEICARAIISISDPKEGYQKIEDIKQALERIA